MQFGGFYGTGRRKIKDFVPNQICSGVTLKLKKWKTTIPLLIGVHFFQYLPL